MRKRIKVSKIIIIAVLTLFVAFCLVPMLMAISVSFTSSSAVSQYGYRLFASEWSVEAYTMLFTHFSAIISAYGVSIFVTVAGVAISLTVTVMVAYPLSVKDFRYAGLISFIVFFTMMFSGGLISYYILTVKYLNLKNNIWVLVITQVLVPSNVFLLRTYFAAVPDSIYESARIDGAGEYRILVKMAAPLALPGIITIALFIVLQYWGDYLTAMLFINIQSLYPLQLLLYRYSNYIQDLSHGQGSMPADESLLFAMCVIATVPMIAVLMFFQKYFIRGLTSGAVK